MLMITQKTAAEKADLLGASSSASTPFSNVSDTRRRFAPTQDSSSEISESPFRNPAPQMMAQSREDHALREHSFIDNSESRIDEFIAQGRAVLDDLVDQRTVLKGTQRRLLDAANTLGLSRDVIGWIERRR